MSSFCQLKVKIQNADTIEFYYAYNKRSNFYDLLEFIAYYFPEKNICPCFKFRGSYEGKEIIDIDSDWFFFNCLNKYTNIELYNPNGECKCKKIIRDNFRKSKIQIIKNITKTFEIDNNKNNLKINEKDGRIIGNYMTLNKNTKFNDFYDIIVDIKSIKDISKGWEIKLSEKAKTEYENLKKEKVIRIGVIGNSNKGKSFLLSKISKINLPVGTNIRTEGLSIKYPDNLEEYQNRRIVLLDSAGLETPVLNENDKGDKIENNLFKEKSREKLITELFLQNYIIKNSDILLIVVGIMTYSEQKLLNRIKLQLKNSKYNKSIFIIHNLMTFTKIEQVHEYIDTVLKKSMTFKLEEGHKISTSTEKEDGIYFVEKNDDNYDFQIYHYIIANEGSEAGDYCNEFTKNQLNKFFIVAKDEPFDVIETIKKNFMEMSEEMLEKVDEPIVPDSFDKEEKDKIKLNKPSNLILKKCLIDELGISNLRNNGFMPVYNYYKKEKENKLIVRVEAPGNCSLKSSTHNSGEYLVLRLEGEKKKDKEPADLKDNIRCNREIGEFCLDIPLKSNEILLKNEAPKISDKKGVFIIEYEIDEKKNVGEYISKEEDDI